jgi:hypothetical protein
MKYAKFKSGNTFFALNQTPIGIYYDGISVFFNDSSANICTVSLTKEWFGKDMYIPATKDEFDNALIEAKKCINKFITAE